MPRVRKAVVLLSGGLDSAVVGTIAKCERYELYCLTIEYGQRHAKEVKHAAKIAQALRAKEHKVVPFDLTVFGGSALTDDIEVPKDRSDEEIESGIPSTYVPARNTIFLGLALAYAEVVEAEAVFIGAHSLDYSGYPDCRPEYMEAMDQVFKLGSRQGVEGKPPRLFAPLLQWDKVRIIETGYDLRAPIKHSWSCYEGGLKQCGQCDACIIRRRAFETIGKTDPVPYKATAARTKTTGSS